MKSIRLRSGLGLAVLILVVGGAIYWWPRGWWNPLGNKKELPVLNLVQYDFDSLKKRGGVASQMEIGGTIAAVETRRKLAHSDGSGFATREISFESDGEKVSGMMNYFPEKNALSPVVIMIRGYADGTVYYPGYGSWAVADKLAEAGYVTVSLDFLGYADSDQASADVMEARFHKVAEVMDLMASVKQLPWVDKTRIGIWAHSNGGQIALSVLEISGQKYPTVLWAPMTDPFPQSILDTNTDVGDTSVTEELAQFEQHYDPRRYAFQNYYPWINAPILIQQGTADSQVKVEWQTAVIAGLKAAGKSASLTIYPGDDHNMSKDWQKVVDEDLGWFKGRL